MQEWIRGRCMNELVSRAHDLAENLLYPSADETDTLPVVPQENLDALAEAGLYGISTVGDPHTLTTVIEILAGACLTTTFVWLQHLGPARLLAADPRWGTRLASGEIRSGVAFAHLRRSGPPALVATADGDGWTITGTAPWVTGWSRIDFVHLAAMRADDPTKIVWFMLDAATSLTMVPQPLDLVAVNASATVELALKDHPAPVEAVASIEDLESWKVRDAAGLRTNGSVALGHATRTIALLGEDAGSLAEQLAQCRTHLDAASSPEALAGGRAAASALAVRAAMALVARNGGSSIVNGKRAQRLAREAMFLLVQGQTAGIRTAQVALFTGSHSINDPR